MTHGCCYLFHTGGSFFQVRSLSFHTLAEIVIAIRYLCRSGRNSSRRNGNFVDHIA
ncbi:Uncharacterised protein [Vibrio cholerae]|nr:Uncharacterised protein [Vibrio cholerae]